MSLTLLISYYEGVTHISIICDESEKNTHGTFNFGESVSFSYFILNVHPPRLFWREFLKKCMEYRRVRSIFWLEKYRELDVKIFWLKIFELLIIHRSIWILCLSISRNQHWLAIHTKRYFIEIQRKWCLLPGLIRPIS